MGKFPNPVAPALSPRTRTANRRRGTRMPTTAAPVLPPGDANFRRRDTRADVGPAPDRESRRTAGPARDGFRSATAPGRDRARSQSAGVLAPSSRKAPRAANPPAAPRACRRPATNFAHRSWRAAGLQDDSTDRRRTAWFGSADRPFLHREDRRQAEGPRLRQAPASLRIVRRDAPPRTPCLSSATGLPKVGEMLSSSVADLASSDLPTPLTPCSATKTAPFSRPSTVRKAEFKPAAFGTPQFLQSFPSYLHCPHGGQAVLFLFLQHLAGRQRVEQPVD